jgi:hypothetical protein
LVQGALSAEVPLLAAGIFDEITPVAKLVSILLDAVVLLSEEEALPEAVSLFAEDLSAAGYL